MLPTTPTGIELCALGHPKIEAIDGIRTRDLSLTKRVLCQLSYDGNSMENSVKAKTYIRPGSNRGPLACEASVITN